MNHHGDPTTFRVTVDGAQFVGGLVICSGSLTNRDRVRLIPDGPMAARILADLRRGHQSLVRVPRWTVAR